MLPFSEHKGIPWPHMATTSCHVAANHDQLSLRGAAKRGSSWLRWLRWLRASGAHGRLARAGATVSITGPGAANVPQKCPEMGNYGNSTKVSGVRTRQEVNENEYEVVRNQNLKS